MASFIKNVFLLVILVLFLTMCDAGVDSTVTMTNDLGAELTVHCKSGDDDLGSHVVAVQGTYEFSFGTHVFGRTLFFCNFQWSGNSHYFDIYIQDRDLQWCVKCKWSIRPEGPFRWNPYQKTWEPFKWNEDHPKLVAP
ncbi:hypothetical protein D8674_018310 [Pyrus ussuriensis x Pyrus communis]|uniref:S-protein homolog n=1 Tax=Pyrus ussuriensis x Pyrus communis TaxID=2448454 RepID=A0A5N5G4W2_9ROSA|nr:hypothetical protein D8674_018310 [Pyrus ussuriensis x Pyrus communis]